MKVLNITYNKGQGGLEYMYLQYNNMLSALGHDVVCMIPPNTLIEKDISYRKVITPYISNGSNKFNFWAIWKLRRLIKEISPDIILLHNSRPLALLNKASKGICPVAVIHHGGGLKRLKKYAQHVICITRYMTAEIEDKKQNTYYLPNVIETNLTYQKRSFPPKGEILNIGVMGRLTNEKGIPTFIHALKHLNIPYRAIIAGDGPQKDFLQNLAQELSLNIEFLGWINGEEKQAFFDQCDLFVIPSHSESFGLVILEGWEHSVPVLSTMTRGGIELIKHGETGFLVEVDNALAMAQAIHKIVTLRNHNDITKKAFVTLKNEYSVENAQERLQSILKDILQADCKTKKNNISNVA